MTLLGRRNVLEALQEETFVDRIEKVIVSISQRTIIDLCEKLNVPYEIQTKAWFIARESKKKYQFATAILKGTMAISMSDLEKKAKFILVLDRIQDPHNVGALLRTALAAGVDAVITQRGEQCPVNYTTLKVSQGYAARVPTYQVKHLADIVKKFREWNYTVVSSSLSKLSIPYTEFKKCEKIALIVGNEGEGVSQGLQKLSHQIVKIPMLNSVESLNVSSSASILLFHLSPSL